MHTYASLLMWVGCFACSSSSLACQRMEKCGCSGPLHKVNLLLELLAFDEHNIFPSRADQYARTLVVCFRFLLSLYLWVYGDRPHDVKIPVPVRHAELQLMQCPPVRQVEGIAHSSPPETKGHENDTVLQSHAYQNTNCLPRRPLNAGFASPSAQTRASTPAPAEYRPLHLAEGAPHTA